MTTNDPAVRYTAGAILVIAFCAALLVAVHGYWDNPNYSVPPVISTVIASAVSGALTLLGVHLGATGSVAGVREGGDIAAKSTPSNGKSTDGGGH